MVGKALLSPVLDLVMPLRCRGCGTRSLEALCEACAGEVVFLEHTCGRCGLPYTTAVPICGRCVDRRLYLDSVVPLYLYGPPLSSLIQAWKFHRDRLAWDCLLGLLREGLARKGEVLESLGVDGVVPVPLHWTRRWWREFNQSLFLAREVAEVFSLSLMDGVVRRVRPTPHQTGLSARERRRNLKGAFRVVGDVKGLSLLLVDDVATTLSTAAEVAKELNRAGAREVHLLVLARAGEEG